MAVSPPALSDGLGRLTDVQTHAPLTQAAFTDGVGTITTTRLDPYDRVTTSFVTGDDGAGVRRVLALTRNVLDAAGAPLFVHTYAIATPPTSVPASLPTGGTAAAGSTWATEELQYDAALRVDAYKPEGHTFTTTADYDGFGLSLLDGRHRQVVIQETPAARQRHATHLMIGEDGGANNSWQETIAYDGRGLPGAHASSTAPVTASLTRASIVLIAPRDTFTPTTSAMSFAAPRRLTWYTPVNNATTLDNRGPNAGGATNGAGVRWRQRGHATEWQRCSDVKGSGGGSSVVW